MLRKQLQDMAQQWRVPSALMSTALDLSAGVDIAGGAERVRRKTGLQQEADASMAKRSLRWKLLLAMLRSLRAVVLSEGPNQG